MHPVGADEEAASGVEFVKDDDAVRCRRTNERTSEADFHTGVARLVCEESHEFGGVGGQEVVPVTVQVDMAVAGCVEPDMPDLAHKSRRRGPLVLGLLDQDARRAYMLARRGLLVDDQD